MLQTAPSVRGQGVGKVVVLIDREDRSDCPGALAAAIQARIARETDVEVAVVIKDAAFENWLVADVDAVRSLKQRFDLSNNTQNAVQPNKADKCPALELLKRSTQGSSYDKVEDSKRILARADATRIATHSRSFRRFLRCAGCPTYASQSRQPAEQLARSKGGAAAPASRIRNRRLGPRVRCRIGSDGAANRAESRNRWRYCVTARQRSTASSIESTW
jgi:hypothetical protein